VKSFRSLQKYKYDYTVSICDRIILEKVQHNEFPSILGFWWP